MNRSALSRTLKALLTLALVACVLPAAASAQATRTWVSGVGDDANPCSRTAPCKTLPGAISKTAAGGEINAIDSGGFGAVSINKSITIDLRSVHGGVLTNVSNGITVNAGANDRVVLRGLRLNGLNSNFHGIRIFQARSVKVIDTSIHNWNRNAISFESTTPGAKLVVRRSELHNNGGNGVLVAPSNGGNATATIRGTDIDDNACGLAVGAFGPDPAFNYAVGCGTRSGNATTDRAAATINSFNNAITDNSQVGAFSRGLLAANALTTIRLSRNEITGNLTGLQALGSGVIASWGDNLIAGNGTDGAATATLTEG